MESMDCNIMSETAPPDDPKDVVNLWRLWVAHQSGTCPVKERSAARFGYAA